MNKITYQLNEKAKTLAKEYLRCEGNLLSVLMEMKKRNAFAGLNSSGIFDYCHRILSLSRAQSYYFKSVAEASVKVPQLKKAVTQGDLTLSQARRITPVITTENQNHWIQNYL